MHCPASYVLSSAYALSLIQQQRAGAGSNMHTGELGLTGARCQRTADTTHQSSIPSGAPARKGSRRSVSMTPGLCHVGPCDSSLRRWQSG
jgi:hypothetical protein